MAAIGPGVGFRSGPLFQYPNDEPSGTTSRFLPRNLSPVDQKTVEEQGFHSVGSAPDEKNEKAVGR